MKIKMENAEKFEGDGKEIPAPDGKKSFPLKIEIESEKTRIGENIPVTIIPRAPRIARLKEAITRSAPTRAGVKKTAEEVGGRVSDAKAKTEKSAADFYGYVSGKCEELEIDPISKKEILLLLASGTANPTLLLKRLALKRTPDAIKLGVAILNEKILPAGVSLAEEDVPKIIVKAYKASKNPLVKRIANAAQQKLSGKKK